MTRVVDKPGVLVCVCGCGQPIFSALATATINPEGTVEVRIICTNCNRVRLRVLGIPEDFETTEE